MHGVQAVGWRLLLQFFPPDGPGGEGHAVRRVAEGLVEMALPPAELERIQRAIGGALRTAGGGGNGECTRAPVRIRIWVSDGCPYDAAQSDPADRAADRIRRCGWGFFLVQKDGQGPQAGAGGQQPAIDLFLYHERSRITGRA